MYTCAHSHTHSFVDIEKWYVQQFAHTPDCLRTHAQIDKIHFMNIFKQVKKSIASTNDMVMIAIVMATIPSGATKVNEVGWCKCTRDKT